MRIFNLKSFKYWVFLSIVFVPNISLGVANTGAQFLRLDLCPRPASMCGAFSAFADDVNTIYYNPAGLSQLIKSEINTSYLKHFAGINSGYIGYHFPMEYTVNIGMAVSYVGISDIEKRTSDTDEADSIFSASDMSFTIAYANKNILGYKLPFGISMKFIYQGIDTEKALGVGFDVGIVDVSKDNKSKAGFVVQNIGLGPKFINTREPLPLSVRLGVFHRMFDAINLSGDINWLVFDKKLQLSIGAECWLANTIALRIGYRIDADMLMRDNDIKKIITSRFGTGIGFAIYQFTLDYAFVPYVDLGNSHIISLGFKF